MASTQIRVLLAEDHAAVRHGLRGFLELLDDIVIVGEADDGAQAVALTEQHRPDVVLIDLLMPVMDGVAATAESKARFPDVEVVALTSFIEEARVTAALEDGATGYLLKDADADDVAVAIRRAHAGEAHLDPQVARLVARRIRSRHDDEPAREPLTEHERAVLSLVAKGHANKGTQAALWTIEHRAG
ncbi:MAG: response regulator transcription factor [Candidatus Limnocylindrales bacterium]